MGVLSISMSSITPKTSKTINISNNIHGSPFSNVKDTSKTPNTFIPPTNITLNRDRVFKNFTIDPNTGFIVHNGEHKFNGFTVNKKITLLKSLPSIWPNKTKAIHSIGINSTTFYNHYHNDSKFKEAFDKVWKESEDLHLDELESTAIMNAKTVRGVADRIFMLKSWRNERYGERKRLEINLDQSSVKNLNSKADAYDIEDTEYTIE
jgi:hypothetical protein